MSTDLMTDQSRPLPGPINRYAVSLVDLPDLDGSNEPQTDRPLMTPVAFDGGSATCFGWLHLDAALRSDVAILICPAVNRDALDSHYGLRLLADRFAASGFPALRFDYPGIGDSCDPGTAESAGPQSSPEYWSLWQRSAQAATDWLRQTTGARRVLFCGLRIGATLAAAVAETRDDVAGLILLAPVLRGRSYMRQLQIEAKLASETRDSSAGPIPLAPEQRGRPYLDNLQVEARKQAEAGGALADGLDFHELHFSAETVGLIGQVDLRHLRLPANLPVAVYAQADSNLLGECVASWRAGGAAVASTDFTGLEPLLRHNIVETSSAPDFSAVMAWLGQALPARRPPPGAFIAPLPAILHPPGCRETALRFGPEGRLFGMLCQPDDPAHLPAATAAPVVIIGNAGRDPHYGFARFGVEFARRLAAAGIASMRIDFAGIGDSIGAPGQEAMLSHMFEVDRGPDINAAIDLLEQLGYRRFAVDGNCAGAYHAFHTALADPRISALLLVNMPVFEWRAGDTIDFATRRTAPPGLFLAKLKQPATWLRLLKGNVHVSRFVRAQALRLAASARQLSHRALRKVGVDGRRSTALTALAVLADRGARTLFLFSPDDSGFDAFQLEFGPNGADALEVPGVSLAVAAEIDHQLSTAPMRHAVTERMIAFLTAPHASQP